LGFTTVDVQVSDSGGMTSTASFVVWVQDSTAPLVTPPATVEVFATGPAGAVVGYPVGSASDSVTALPFISYSKASGTAFPIGITTVTVYGIDDSGNAGEATFTVTVRNNAPVGVADQVVRLATSTTAKIQVSALLANDSDVELDALSIIGVGNATPAGASVSLVGGFVVYTVPESGAGNGGFTYTVSDGNQNSTGTVSVVAEGASGTASPNAAKIQVEGSAYVLRFIGVPSRQYRIQYTTDVTPPRSWRDFDPPVVQTVPASGVIGHTDVNPTEPSRFYRIVPQP
jgi:hypothetical protein